MRYSRQEKIPGWNQGSISNAKIALIGSNNLASFIATDLVAMGFGNVTHVGQANFLVDLEKLNPEVHFQNIPGKILNEDMASDYFSLPNLMIDASDLPKEKEVFLRYARRNSIPVISARATPHFFSVADATRMAYSELADFQRMNVQSQSDSIENAISSAGIAVNEARKKIMPLPNEKQVPKSLVYVAEQDLPKKVLVVGAGAIGTFTSIALAMHGADITIADFDKVELSNLNRQVLFYDSIGRFKAEAAAEKLSRFGKAKGLVEKITPSSSLGQFDLILGCVDNSEARYALTVLARQNNTLFIDGGTSISSGKVRPYQKGRTACLDCQGFGKSTLPKPTVEDGSCYEPTNIISNQIIAGLQVAKITAIQQGNYDTIKYDSNLGIRAFKTLEACFKTCPLK